MNFKDHFSKVASGYATFRPSYPPALFEWLAHVPARRLLAWDCACGTGQATTHLSRHFAQVIGTDASESQIGAAPLDSANVRWRVAKAEQSGLESHTVDLVTVAQAVHWFDLPAFYAEAKRVLRPDGALVVWCYGINEVEGAAVNEIVLDFYARVVGPFWPPERKLIEDGYRTLEFPFREISVPSFHMREDWDLEQLLGYFRTWSATTRYIEANQVDPITVLRARLAPEWGEPQRRRGIRWPLSFRAGFP